VAAPHRGRSHAPRIKPRAPAFIIFAVDYPFESSKAAREFIESASLTATQRARIMSGNAEEVFKICSRQSPT
jgi:predicted TIM-barrel fold metal-dependent hydrolase